MKMKFSGQNLVLAHSTNVIEISSEISEIRQAEVQMKLHYLFILDASM
jgi:hypothetical protein